MAGKPLDWKKYRGKTVLIDFFATWCEPCRDEVPNITRCYKAYSKRGFDVIGISIDRDRKAIEICGKGKTSWIILLDRNEARGTTNRWLPITARNDSADDPGWQGRQSAVLNARGKLLREKLEELLGPVEERRTK